MSTDIECKLQRKGGTEVTIDTTTYHFAPREDGAHVAAVANEAHADRFLGIPEGYRLYRGTAAAAPIANEQMPVSTDPDEAAKNTGGTPGTAEPSLSDNILLGSDDHPATFDINGKIYSLGDVVAMAHKASGLDVKEWNELEGPSRADLVDEQLELLSADTNGDGQVDASEERAQLAEQYKAKFGKAPHGKWTAERIRTELTAG